MAEEIVFVDTSAWYALITSKDTEHRRAVKTWENLIQERCSIITSDWVLSELVALVERRLGRDLAEEAGKLILEESGVRMHFVDRHILHLAWTKYLNSGHPSLVDCSSFELMNENGVKIFFAFDEDFKKAGFVSI